ncbi:MAG: hypothetical protein IPJ65_18975 [Archangiaceae bacterium]|nr:hypothetical protein [Archangiaceae bacterium]
MVFERAPQPILIVDGEGRLLEQNLAARELNLAAAIDDAALTRSTARLRDLDGRLKLFTLSRVPLTGDRVALFAEDTTALNQASSELALVRRLDSLGTLTGALAQDLESVLEPLIGVANLLEGRVAQEAPVPALWQKLRAGLHHSLELLRRLRAYLAEERPAMAPVDATRALRELQPLLELVAHGSAGLVLTLDEETGEVSVDLARLQQVLLSLVANAREASAPGSEINVSIATVALDAEAARQRDCKGPGPYVAISVGCTRTADAATTGRVFQPFTTAPSSTGVGLAAVWRFCREHGGGLDTRSRVGGVSEVTLYLPRAAPKGRETGPTTVDPDGVFRASRRGSSTAHPSALPPLEQ